MERLIGLLTSIIFALLMVVMVATRAHPDNADLSILLPDTCATPCWQGIQPGVTTAEEAIAILQAHPWIQPESVRGSQNGAISPTTLQANMRISWQWNRELSAVARYISPEFASSYIQASRGIIQYIRITTLVPYGEVQALMGAPDSGTLRIDNPGSENRRYGHSAGYFGGQVVFDSAVSCPITSAEFWNAPVIITYSDGSYQSLTTMPEYDLIQQIYADSCGI